MTDARLFDQGLQPERTQLAWRRTSLSFGVGGLLAIRLLPEALGDPLWALAGVAIVLASAGFWLASDRRNWAMSKSLLGAGDVALPGGGLLLVLGLVTSAAGLTGLVVAAMLQ